MNVQDWEVCERLTRIRRSYLQQGHSCEPSQHYLTADLGAMNPGAFSPVVEVVSPPEGIFVWFGQSAFVRDSNESDDTQGNPTLADPVMVSMTREKNQKLLVRGRLAPGGALDAWAPLQNLFGTGQRPHFWPFPIYLMRRDRLLFQAQADASGPTIHELRLTLLGFRMVIGSLARAGELG